LRKYRRNAGASAFSTFRVTEWSVRRKVVAVLAIPVVLAAVFGGLRVRSELQDASTYNTNQQRATVLDPTINYLAATQRLALPASLSTALSETDAKTEYANTAAALKRASANAGLTADQSGYITQMMQIGDTLESGGGTGITATPSTAGCRWSSSSC
jgi:hypothetical protein